MNPKKATYEVGYGKPPQQTRFKPGQSGNPRGRPKGSLNLVTAFNRALRERVTIVENGSRKSISKLEATIKGLVNRAVKGDPRATQLLISLAPLIGADGGNQGPITGAGDDAIVANVMKQLSAQAVEPEIDTP